MPDDYVPIPYPKWVNGQVVNGPDEEAALNPPAPLPEPDDRDKRNVPRRKDS